jgi:hypothetical protein
MAVRAAADVLARVDSEAIIFYRPYSETAQPESGTVHPRANMRPVTD